MKPKSDVHRGWLPRLKAAKLFSNPQEAEDRVISRLGRAGYFFVATSEEAMAMDLLAGPKQPINLSGGRVAPPPVPESEIPHLYEPWFVDLIVSALLHYEEHLGPVRRDGEVVLYRFPEEATTTLSELTPERADLCRATTISIADELMSRKEVSARFQKSGVLTAALIVRGHALGATPRNADKELYYWFWQTG